MPFEVAPYLATGIAKFIVQPLEDLFRGFTRHAADQLGHLLRVSQGIEADRHGVAFQWQKSRLIAI